MDRKKIIEELNKDAENFINENFSENKEDNASEDKDFQSMIEEKLDAITDNLNERIAQALSKVDKNEKDVADDVEDNVE